MYVYIFYKKKLHAWILPIMQGYVQCEPCQIDEHDFDFILISRRSRERAGTYTLNTQYFFLKLLLNILCYEFVGLRYQRRGINEDGAVANFVETEQILSIEV